jgi:hypothetical protein
MSDHNEHITQQLAQAVAGIRPEAKIGAIVGAVTRRFPDGHDVKLLWKVQGTSCWVCKWGEGYGSAYVLESEMRMSSKPFSHYV